MPILLTQQFRYCGNAFRADMYRGCNFGCSYCYVSNRKGAYKNIFDIADISRVERMFERAFESDCVGNFETEMLRHKVPLHVGGMSDPFQEREFELGLSYRLIELSNKYSYPMMFCTKQANFPDEYWQALSPELHAFQVSLIGADEDYIRLYEHNTPSPLDRIDFVHKLKAKGFWVSIRLQPLISITRALDLLHLIGKRIDYCTVEHLKIGADDRVMQERVFSQFGKGLFYKPRLGRSFEMLTEIKEGNIDRIKKQFPKLLVGVGDNDLHHMTDSRCCCGIDTVNSNFNNWMKYNETYFVTGTYDKRRIWYPKKPFANQVLNSSQKRKGFETVKDYVDDFMGWKEVVGN